MICHELRLLFIDITKTAGTAITKGFIQAYPEYHIQDHMNKHHSVKNFSSKEDRSMNELHKTWTCIEIVTDIMLNSYITFTVVRNPYDRLVSTWLWGRNRVYNIPFDRFVYNVNSNKYTKFNSHQFRTQLDWITDINGDVRVENILRYETLEYDFGKFLKKYNFKNFSIPITNTAKQRSGMERKSYEHYYNDETKHIIQQMYKEDLEYFNYEF